MLSQFYDEKASDVYFYIGGLEEEFNDYIDLNNIEDYYDEDDYDYDDKDDEKNNYYDELADYYDSYYDDYNDY